jgi:hypothetical protein
VLLRIASVAAAALAVLIASEVGAASTASAATCSQRVIADWRDGHIDGTYGPRCLRAALRNLPEDLRIYGSAEEDITRALNKSLVKAETRRAASRTLASSRAPSGRPAAKRVAAAVATHVADSEDGFPFQTVLLAAAAALAAAAVAASIWRTRRR